MSPKRESVAQTRDMPQEADVVVIGGGIVGIAAAYFLAGKGLRVVVLEKGEVAAEQSSRNWGFLRQQGRSPAELPLIKRSIEIWGDIQRETGEDLGYRRTGTLYVSDQKDAPEAWQIWADTCRELDIGVSMLTAAQTQEALPSTIRWTHGIQTPSDGFAEPARAVPFMARAATARGAMILQGCAARLLEIAGGRVHGIHTEKGFIKTPVVLCAGGAWTGLFLRRHGIKLPQLVAKASVLRTVPMREISRFGGIGFREFTVRRRDDGGYNIARPMGWTYEIVPDAFRFLKEFWPAFMQQRQSMKLRIKGSFLDELSRDTSWGAGDETPFEKKRIWDPAADDAVLDLAYRAFRRAFPDAGISKLESWAGMIDITPDAAPVIGKLPGIEGLHVATGFSGHGFAMGPGGGRLAADIITDGEKVVDPAPYRFERLGTTRIARDLSPG